MPRDYGKIRHGFWSGTGETRRRLRTLPMEVQTVAAYLMSCGSSNMIGLYYLPLPLVVHEIGSGLTIDGALEALRRLSEVGFAHYDEETEIVFVPNMAREQVAENLKPNDTQIKGVIAQLEEYRNSRFVADFLAIYREPYHLPDLAPPKAPRRPIEGPPKPESRDQGSESRDQNTCPPAKPGGPLELSLDLSDGQASPSEPTEADQVRAVFAHYRGKHPRAFPNPQPGTTEWRLIVARLKEGSTVEDLCNAIDGYHLSPHHQGHNDRSTKYLGLELMVRNGTHVLNGLEFKANPPKPSGGWKARPSADRIPARATRPAKPATGPRPGAYAEAAAKDRGVASEAVSNLVGELAAAKGAVG